MTSIPGFENYLIYRNGRIYSLIQYIYLKPCKNEYGHLCINLCKNGKRYRRSIHRLLGLLFIPNPENKPYIRHIDGNNSNNRVSNLIWSTCICSKNCQNTGVMSNNKLGITNISFSNNRYRFQKTYFGKTHQKYFRTLDEAIAYKESYLSTLE